MCKPESMVPYRELRSALLHSVPETPDSTDDGTSSYRFRMNIFAVPEPSSLAALALALAMGAGARRFGRRRR